MSVGKELDTLLLNCTQTAVETKEIAEQIPVELLLASKVMRCVFRERHSRNLCNRQIKLVQYNTLQQSKQMFVSEQ